MEDLLGIEIDYLEDGSIKLHQTRYVEKIIEGIPDMTKNAHKHGAWELLKERGMEIWDGFLTRLRDHHQYLPSAPPIKMRMPSHGDLIGKTALLQFPELVNHTHCPNPTRAKQELGGAPNLCETFLSPVEHVRHPIQDCHAARCRYVTAGPAAQYGIQLLNGSRRFAAGLEPLPPAQSDTLGRSPSRCPRRPAVASDL